MVRKNGRRRSKRVEEDPMTGIANLVDAMLVILDGERYNGITINQ